MAELKVTHDQIRASRVEGTKVYNTAGEHLGAVDDIVLSKQDGKAAYAIISFGGFLGIGEEYHALPWSAMDYDPSRGGYVVNLSREQLEGAPRFRREAEPDWNDPVYTRGLSSYYGLTHL